MTIEQLPKGALPDPIDLRDYDALGAGLLGAPIVDWDRGSGLSEPPDSDQANADCCVGESWSYFHWQLVRKIFSVRSLFAYIALPDYGAYIRDGGLRLKKKGQETFEEAPDPNPKTAQNMRSKLGLDENRGLDDIEADAYTISAPTIDYIAEAILRYKGVVFGLNGTNRGWQNLEIPEPPFQGENGIWGHALYGFDFHWHTEPDGRKIKCIIAKSSWCRPGVVTRHHIRQHYYTSGNIFSPWVLIPKRKEHMRVVKDSSGTVWLVGNKGRVAIASLAALNLLNKVSDQLEDGDVSSVPDVGLLDEGLIIDFKKDA